MGIEGTNGKYLFYRPVAPRLTGPNPAGPVRLGLHCKNFDTAELIAHARLPVNLMEVKPECFTGSDRLFMIRRGKVALHRKNFARLAGQAARQGLALQFHFPDRIEGWELNPGVVKHHRLILSYFAAIAKAVGDHGLLPNVSFHLPLLYWGKRKVIPGSEAGIARALQNTRLLFLKLAIQHAAQGWPLKLGVENQADPTRATHILGYLTGQLEAVTAATPDWINFTLDVGHSLLSKRMTVAGDLLPLAARLGKEVINIHFHENRGEQSDTDHGDDHALPTGAKIPDYLHYLNRAVQERAPLVLEVDTSRYTPEQLLVVSTGIRALMEQIEAERTD